MSKRFEAARHSIAPRISDLIVLGFESGYIELICQNPTRLPLSMASVASLTNSFEFLGIMPIGSNHQIKFTNLLVLASRDAHWSGA
jgi:hypothetical protein